MDGDLDGFLDAYLTAKWKGFANVDADDDDLGDE